MKQSTIDGINAALDHAKEKHGDQWMGALPLEQRGIVSVAEILRKMFAAENLADDALDDGECSRTSVIASEIGEALFAAYGRNHAAARAELLQVAAMAAQWAEDLEGDGR